MHVCAGHVHVEIFDGDTPVEAGEFGDIVATSLRNTAMPLVRYRVGDRGRLSPRKCQCGAPQPVLLDLQARSEDQFQTAAGDVRHGSEIVSRLDEFYADTATDPVRQVQFVQKNRIHWEVLVETGQILPGEDHASQSPPAITDKLTKMVRRTFGQDCAVEIRFIDEIPRVRGKLRYYRKAELPDA
jgi:phenylacetate-CoA ligase